MFFMYFFVLCASACGSFVEEKNGYVLKQVIAIGRHHLRTPLTDNLAKYSPYTWPEWSLRPGMLTDKGKTLEGHMGEYFTEEIKLKGLINDTCPSEEDLQVIANVRQRTVESAEAFVKYGFRNCKININKKEISPILYNHTDEFVQQVKDAMRNKLDSMKDETEPFEVLQEIVDLRNSDACVVSKLCKFEIKDTDELIVLANAESYVDGALRIGNSIVDTFLMQYYEGFEETNVAWGKIPDEETWKKIMRINKNYHDVIFNTTITGKEAAKPLMRIIENAINSTQKLTLIIGHDSNILSLFRALNFKNYNLKNSPNSTPIGGIVVFQKWHDASRNIDLLKVNYVYQTTEQIRKSEKISTENKPEIFTLEINGCEIDNEGFCMWDDFLNVFSHVYE